MLVQAKEINYDYANERVSAVGNVQIYYNGSVLEANKVIYDQKTKRLRAEGNARLTEPGGQVSYGEIMELSDDYRDGFVDSLRVDAAQQTSIAAARAERSGGNFSIFHSGVYTACEPCKDNPKKPPLWQIKAARIIHDQGEKMLYFEQASLEFYGMPIAYLPYFSAPDPTVKRKTGFLAPTFSSERQDRLRHRDPVFLGAGSELRSHAHADDDDEAGPAAGRPNGASAPRTAPSSSAARASGSGTRAISCIATARRRRAIANSAAASKAPASSTCPTNGDGAGTSSRRATRPSSRTTTPASCRPRT